MGRSGSPHVEPVTVGDQGPRRTSLAQERSRRTRRDLVRAALELWTARGFERGIEETTVEEIARAAGVTKGTFYFHFAHKEDILLELGWGTAEAMDEAVEKAVALGLPPSEVLDLAVSTLVRRVERVPRVAALRAVREFYRPRLTSLDLDGHFGIRRSFEHYVTYAQSTGELPQAVEPAVLASILQSLTIDALTAWAAGDDRPLAPVLRYAVAVGVAGAKAVAHGDLGAGREL